jgi:hypothetical protein
MVEEQDQQGRLQDQVEKLFAELLADGSWMRLDELERRIPDDLAEAKVKQTNPLVYQDMADPVAYGRYALGTEAIKALVASDEYETGRAQGKERIRLIERPAPRPKAAAERPALKAATQTTPAEPNAKGTSPGLPDHEVAALFPLLNGEEYDQFKEDIRVNGQQEDIVVHDGKIVDGRNRYRACRQLGIDPRLREWDGKGSLLTFVLSKNLARRHLTTEQRAMIAAKLKPFYEQEAGERMRTGKAPDPGANLPQGRSRDLVAATMHVSPRTVEAASKVLGQGTPELAKAVESGQASVSAAAEVADLPHEEQRTVVAGGKKAVAGKAKQVREQKARRGSSKKTPEPSTGKRASSGSDSPKPSADDKGKPKGILIRKTDSDAKITRELSNYLGEKRAAKIGKALVGRTR